MNDPENRHGGTAMSQRRGAYPQPELRDVIPDEVAGCLRAMLGLAPDDPARGEQAAYLGRSLPAVVHGLDASAWIAWCMAGLPLFGGRLPTVRLVKVSASRVVMALAMLQTGGNISAAARMLGTSRRALRDGLRRMGRYPWRETSEPEVGRGWTEGSKSDGEG